MLKGSKFLKHQAELFFKTDNLLRSKHSKEGFKLKALVQNSSVNFFHQSQVTDYPTTEALPLPLNIEDLASENLKFSPQRSRDINGSLISSSTLSFNDFDLNKNYQIDNIIECYDCSGIINLSSAMETNVPFPFVSREKPVHLNMCNEQWGLKEKYVSEELNNVHFVNSSQQKPAGFGTSCSLGRKTGNENFYFCIPMKKFNFSFQPTFNFIKLYQFRNFCSIKEKVETTEKNLNKNVNVMKDQKQKFKTAVKQYGSVFIVYHISISLIFLGCCYVAVSSGIDLTYIIKQYGADDGAAAVGTAANFVVAYAVHKVMAPVRLAWSIATVPFVVNKLRKVGILKNHKSKIQ